MNDNKQPRANVGWGAFKVSHGTYQLSPGKTKESGTVLLVAKEKNHVRVHLPTVFALCHYLCLMFCNCTKFGNCLVPM